MKLPHLLQFSRDSYILATNLLIDIHGISFVNITFTQKIWKRVVKFCIYINLGICSTCDIPLLKIYASYQNNVCDFSDSVHACSLCTYYCFYIFIFTFTCFLLGTLKGTPHYARMHMHTHTHTHTHTKLISLSVSC